jgi:hypothetical protein
MEIERFFGANRAGSRAAFQDIVHDDTSSLAVVAFTTMYVIVYKLSIICLQEMWIANFERGPSW